MHCRPSAQLPTSLSLTSSYLANISKEFNLLFCFVLNLNFPEEHRSTLNQPDKRNVSDILVCIKFSCCPMANQNLLSGKLNMYHFKNLICQFCSAFWVSCIPDF